MLDTPTILEIPPYDEHVKYGGCMQRSTSLALRAEGIEPPLLLGKFWRFSREWGPPFRNKASFAMTTGDFHVFAARFDDTRDALAKHQIEVVTCRGMGADESWARILARLEARRPTPILLDNFYLRVHESFYQKVHGTHVFAVGGYEASTDTVHVFNVRESLEDWQIPRSTLTQAWATEEYTFYDIVPASAAPYPSQAIRADLLACIREMLPAHRGEHWSRGVPAIRRFADDLEAYQGRDPDHVRAVLEDGFHQLPPIREQRLLMGRSLQVIGESLALPALIDLGVTVTDLGKAWSVARNWFLRAIELDLSRGLTRLAAKLREVADAEELALIRLGELCESGAWRMDAAVPLTLRQ